jgi:hypothetical protein
MTDASKKKVILAFQKQFAFSRHAAPLKIPPSVVAHFGFIKLYS